MKKLLSVTVLIIMSMVCYAGIEKYYIGNVEVSRDDYHVLDTTLLGVKEIWTDADTVRYVVWPNMYSRIDSSSVKGRVSVIKKTAAELAVIDSIIKANRTESAILKVGDTIPDFTFYDYLFQDREPWSYKDLLKGNVILLNFWATWCGPCVEELKPEHLPSLLEEFREDDNFVFLPVSVNHTNQELVEFFESPKGKELNWLESKTAWDKNGEFSSSLSKGGIPLTILIDKDGIIRLNEAGAFLSKEQKRRLRAKIAELLQQSAIF